MRDVLIIFISIILAVGVGGYLYLYGAPTQTESDPAPKPEIFNREESIVVLAEGNDSGTQTRRTNYRITTDEQLIELWRLIYGEGGAEVPQVNFSQHEVIAVFDGTHSTGGYRVLVSRVKDEDGQRQVSITREEPGETCVVTQGISSPFHIVRVSKTSLPITRQETVVVNECQ